MGSFGTLNTIILVVYLGLMVAVGLYFSRRSAKGADFFLAGGNMPWLAVAMSMFASLTSAVTYMGVPGRAFEENVGIFFGVAVSPIVAPILILTIYPFYKRLGVTTSYEYIYHRFGSAARYCVSVFFILARLGWLGTVIFAPALALSAAAGLDIWISILLMGILATLYTVLGGLGAVLWTDVVQFIILTGGAIWIAVSLTGNVDGGVSAVFSVAQESGRLDVLSFMPRLAQMTALTAMVNWFFIFLSDYGADQVTVQRLMSVRKYSGICKAVVFNSFTDVILVSLLLYIGLGLFAWYSQNPDPAVTAMKADRVLVYYVMHQLPAGISGLIVTAIFAAAMSSMDSGIHSLSTVIVHDLLRPFGLLKPAQEGVFTARILTCLLGISATAMAFYAQKLEGIVQAWSSVMGLFGGPALALFILGVLSRRASFTAWAVAAGFAVAVNAFVQSCKLLHWVYFFPLSVACTLLLGLLISLFVPEKRDVTGLTCRGRFRNGQWAETG